MHVNGNSAGPIKTRAPSSIKNLSMLPSVVGKVAAFLLFDFASGSNAKMI